MSEGEIITLMTYEEWEHLHKEAQREKVLRRRRKRAREKSYFRKQKFFGLLICGLGLATAAAGEYTSWNNLSFLGIVVVGFGFYTAVTQKHLIVR